MTSHEPETLAARPFTKTGLLADLRSIESKLFSDPVVDEIRSLSLEQRQEFVAARLHLTKVIARINASLMRDIREALEAQTVSLREGIAVLQTSLAKLQGVSQWAGAVSRLLTILGKVVPLI